MGQKSSKTADAIDSRFLAPQKLYCYNEVDLRKLRRLIKDRKLAPCYYGTDPDAQQDCEELEDCPICFLGFPSINRAVCCHKPICTECFLQVKSLQTGNCPKCPYCKADFAIYYHGKNTPEQAIHNRLEEQQQAEAAARSRQGEQQQREDARGQPMACNNPTLHGRLSDFTVLLNSADQSNSLDDFMLMQGISASLQEQAPASALQAASTDTCCQPPISLQQHTSTPSNSHGSCLLTAAIPAPAVGQEQFQAQLPAHVLALEESRWTALSKPDGFIQITTHPSGSTDQIEHEIQAPVVTGLSPSPASSALDCIQAAYAQDTHKTDSQQQPHMRTSMSAQQFANRSDTQNSATEAAEGYGDLDHMQPAKTHSSRKQSSRSNPIRLARSINPFSSQPHTHSKQQANGPLPCTAPSSLKSGASSLVTDSLASFLQQQGRVEQWPSGYAQTAPSLEMPPQTPCQLPATTAPSSQHEAYMTRQNSVVAAPSHSKLPHATEVGSCNLIVGMAVVDTASPVVPSNPESDIPQQAGPSATPGPSAPQHSLSSAPGTRTSTETASVGDMSVQAGESTGTSSGASHAPGSLTGGAVLLQNPDGSLQYVMLTGEDQIAVQLSLKAKQAKQAQQEAAGTNFQEESTPEDQALQARIARGDDLLRHLYAEGPHSQPRDEGPSSSHGTSDKTATSEMVEGDAAMLQRMRDADAALQAMFARSSG